MISIFNSGLYECISRVIRRLYSSQHCKNYNKIYLKTNILDEIQLLCLPSFHQFQLQWSNYFPLLLIYLKFNKVLIEIFKIEEIT